jgi:hypothetical protein
MDEKRASWFSCGMIMFGNRALGNAGEVKVNSLWDSHTSTIHGNLHTLATYIVRNRCERYLLHPFWAALGRAWGILWRKLKNVIDACNLKDKNCNISRDCIANTPYWSYPMSCLTLSYWTRVHYTVAPLYLV